MTYREPAIAARAARFEVEFCGGWLEVTCMQDVLSILDEALRQHWDRWADRVEAGLRGGR